MKKKILTLVAAAVMTMAMSVTSFAAIGQWRQDSVGWWWEREGGSYLTNQWMWIDGNADGIVECYCFGPDGYMLANTTTPDGYTVDANGAWTVNGVVQSRGVLPEIDDAAAAVQDTSGAVTDPDSVAQITINQEVWNSIGNMESTYPFDMTKAISLGDNFLLGKNYYQYDYNGIQLRISATKIGNTDRYGMSTAFGPAKAFVNNIPANGIEVDAFYMNSGFSDPWGDLNHVQASTGNLDRVFGVPAASFRALWAESDDCSTAIVYIQLTQGADGNWYVYPDSSAYLAPR